MILVPSLRTMARKQQVQRLWEIKRACRLIKNKFMNEQVTKKVRREAKVLPRVLLIVGPTSSGKTGLSLRAAREINGEIINADARQVYKGCSIGTGRPPGHRGKYLKHDAFFVRVPHEYTYEQLSHGNDQLEKEMTEIPHYLMDFLAPDKIMTVAQWREKASKAIKGIVSRKHVPIVVGGTGLYISTLVNNFSIPHVPPNQSLRLSFEQQPLAKLVDLLLKMDPSANSTVDLKNSRRVIRALEICTFTGKPISKVRTKRRPVIDPFFVGIKQSREELHRRIDASIQRMMEEGWPEEVRELHEKGISWNAPSMTSIGYREIGMYLRGEIMLEEAIRLAKLATYHYAKRQETWFKRETRIHWVKDEDEGMEVIREWNNSNLETRNA